ASVANRVSYVLNFHGPSVTVDTMCSSSLTAIHYACLDLKVGRTTLAVAGGVNVSIHPNKYLVLSGSQFISSDGHCQSFGEGGDGYIPGEGVGAVVLKRLADAERDGDHIYAIIRGSALNHGGKTNGIAVPNPHAQASVIGRALAEAGIDARDVSYIEAHGTGTKLGDPIEIAALVKGFQRYTTDTAFCRIGSAKSNIGHCESAAGIAGLTKVVLQMQHQEIVPSLHSARLNPHIDFASTPFVVNQSVMPWERRVVDGRPVPRIAGISSFGAGGSNAHVLLEEYEAPVRHSADVSSTVIVLSARTTEQLQEKARQLLDFVLASGKAIDLASVAYTLQVGREAMDERLGLIVNSVSQLNEKLRAYLAGEQSIEGVFTGQVKRNREALAVFSTDADLQQTVEKWIDGRKVAKLLDLWVKGLELDWSRLYGEEKPVRVSLPTYPFAREHYWIETTAIETHASAANVDVLHPLLHRNTSDLTRQTYSSTFTGDEPFLVGRQLPAAALLEIARAAIEDATRRTEHSVLELRDVVWTQPVTALHLDVALSTNQAGEIEFEIAGEDDVVVCQGRAVTSTSSPAVRLDAALLEPLQAPKESTASQFVLHPTVIESALDGAAFGIRLLRVFASCNGEMRASIRSAGDDVDIDICDERGEVCVQMHGVRRQTATAQEPVAPAVVVMETPKRREILFATAENTGKKRLALSLVTPATPAVTSAPAGRARITLAGSAPGVVPATTTAAPISTPVRLFDDEHGVFAIEIVSSRATGMMGHLLQALDRVQQEPSLEVLTINGLEYCFSRGDRDEANEALDRKLFQQLLAFPYPTIAVLPGDVIGAGLLAASLCDFLVCAEDAQYGFTDLQSGFVPTPAETALFRERFGTALADDLLYFSLAATGKQLREKGWTCPIAPHADVEKTAAELASRFVTKSQAALRLLKQHLTRQLGAFVDALTPAASSQLDTTPQVLVVPYAQFGEVSETSKAVVLTGIEDHITEELQERIAASNIPVVVALRGDARGSAWLASLLADACVYSADGNHSAAGLGASPLAASVFEHRFGDVFGREILLAGSSWRTADLAERVGTLLVAAPDQVVDAAVEVAEKLARLPRIPRTAWKRTEQEESEASVEGIVATAPLRSNVVTLTAHPDGVVVVELHDRQAKNMFSEDFIAGVTEAFAHIEQTPSYKVVVLTGYDHYFAAGGTKEALLAIQEGKTRFTDVDVFRLPIACKLPVVAAVQGHALGAGWAMAMHADFVLLSDESRYVSPYMDYGFTPGAGATAILAERMGHDLARESLLTAQFYAGSELKRRGLRLPILPRSEVVPAAMKLASELARAGRGRLIARKQQWAAPLRETLEETYRRELAMHEQTFVGQSETLEKIRQNFLGDLAEPALPVAQSQAEPAHAAPIGDALPGVLATLRTLLANELQLRETEIDDHAQFVDVGLDSISGVTWIRRINERYQTAIEATKVYSHSTLDLFARHVRDEAEKRGTLPTAAVAAPTPQVAKDPAPRVATTAKLTSRIARIESRFAAAKPTRRVAEPIAVIGMAGQFPQATNLRQYWQNISEGRNCVTRVPRKRWDLSAWYQPGDPVPGKTNCPWLGGLDEYDLFDPLFFNISPTEALSMDPQQRLFLQTCWHGIEDAGYDPRSLAGSRSGVFVGCAAGDYLQSSRQHALSAQGFTGGAMSILAARISYFLDLKGPCISIDTACSSSLVAIANACDSLNSGGCDLALAGGVYVMAGPDMHIMTAQAAMLSPDGKCYTFDQRANGFVPGEGVGVVLLKRLADAERDGDIIRGVIQGWGVNQDGKTNGITAPNPESQTRLEQEVYDRYGIDPEHIQLIEAHGTGTKLGDPIEVEGLKQAFRKYTEKTSYCAIGSVKSNIGHTLTAAGIAGVLKLMLSLQHEQLPPTIHFERINEHIDLDGSPFFVNRELQPWTRNGAPRQAAISSFGFSGTNAHIVIGEYTAPSIDARPASSAPALVPLSARTAEQLEQKARDLLEVLRRNPRVALSDVAYTLQVGRPAMDERLGFVASSVDELARKLEAWLEGEASSEEAYRGQVRRGKPTLAVLGKDGELTGAVVEKCLAENRLATLLELWIHGVQFDWQRLYGDITPRRVSLPVYPFAKERYWLDRTTATAADAAVAVLHPLLYGNTSDLARQRYTSKFSGEESFLSELAGHRVLSAGACLEMARVAVERALPEQNGVVVELRDTVWGEPFVVDGRNEVHIALTAASDEQVDFDIYSQDVVHCQGRAAVSRHATPAQLDLQRFAAEGETLVSLAVEDVAAAVILEAALQAAVGSLEGATPAALDTLRVFTPLPSRAVAWVRNAAGRIDVDLCDTAGNVSAQLYGLSWQMLGKDEGVVLATPAWQTSTEREEIAFAERHVILCDLPSQETTIATRYSESAVSCFERIRTILQSKPEGNVLVQVVVADDGLLAGLTGMLRTANLENPRLIGQLIVVHQNLAGEELNALLENERSSEPIVRYERGVRQVQRWQEVVAHDEPAIAFQNDGVYLITGGLGSLGLRFTTEILDHAPQAAVILTGRASATETRLPDAGGRVSYRQVDLEDAEQVRQLIASIREQHGRLDGILHCAGMAADDFIVRKTSDELRRVLAPKVAGADHLDQATRDVELDFFVLFSSIAGVLGNPGQADYSAANGFLDRFAAWRNALVATNERHGRTRSINWPLWQDGGMAIDAAGRERVLQTIGAQPMQTATGLAAFHRALALPCDQLLVVEGIPSRIREYLRRARVLDGGASRAAAPARKSAPKSAHQLQLDLKAMLAAVLRIEATAIDSDQPFAEYGLDSFLGAELIAKINRTYELELSHARLFDYTTAAELARFLELELRKQPEPIAAIAAPESPMLPIAAARRLVARTARRSARATNSNEEKIAIVGMSGRYPQAGDLDQFWRNLADGRNAITEVPSSRWDVDRYFDSDRTKKNKTYSKWLGALDDVDRFDPLFFRISPQEAELIDPQHRLFLQESYRAFEDAGYSTTTLSNTKCGVYLGITTNEYTNLLSRAGVLAAPVTGNSFAIAAARIAYHLNLKGPAISVDTACSSSLVSVHLACQALLNGEIDMALAGGVSLWLTPDSYVAMSKAGMFSPDGQCKTFDDSANGIVNGEGVGAVVLKRLSDAEADGDVIHGVILGSGINQDGRTNGITAPSVNSQIELERSIYAKHGIAPETIGYVEAHGTGTKLGDPIELEALATVFGERTSRRNFCAIGSAKSNIGHTTAAAGVAGLHKVLLSMRHRTLVPTLNIAKESSRFDFAGSPFYVNRETKTWAAEPGSRRRAAVSSFGFSGTNAHLVVEEYPSPVRNVHEVRQTPVIVPLSARSPEQLQQKARDLRSFLRTSQQPVDLASVAYTLSTGREAMEERLAFVASSTAELAVKLDAWMSGDRSIGGIHRGRVEPGGEGMTFIGRDDAMQEAIDKWIARRNLDTLADSWVRGLSLDWSRLHDGGKSRRVSLPTYPFAKERCWFEDQLVPEVAEERIVISAADCDSIENIIDLISGDGIESADAVQALRMLV
ncbi:MAG: SDR family NAD(P)-dependent oxidoreductase, partial [Acidobacteria bacterium]|nr:SDR family NAD(P)-dependent oxidoreductase [Acidobacteriota bacterium]